MIIVNDASGDYPDGPTVKINLTKHSDPNGDVNSTVLFYGYNSVFNGSIREKYRHFKKKILLNLWMPTEFNCDAPFTYGRTDWQPEGKFLEYFDSIYTICPYTKKWLEDVAGDTRYKYIWHPFASPEDYGGQSLDYTKKYDVCYFGGIHGKYHRDMAIALKKYNSRISYIHPNEFTTDVALTHHQKMQMVANTKISIVFNQCPLSYNHIQKIKSYKDWQKNRAFGGVDYPVPTMPQYKCRTAEAGYGKSIILVQRDDWNIIEDFFEEGKDFIYFNDIDDMTKKIEEVLSNYDSYSSMLESAHQKSLLMDGLGTLNKIKEIENV